MILSTVLKLGSSGIIIPIVQMKRLGFPQFKHLTEVRKPCGHYLFSAPFINLSLALVYMKLLCCYGNRAWVATNVVQS